MVVGSLYLWCREWVCYGLWQSSVSQSVRRLSVVSRRSFVAPFASRRSSVRQSVRRSACLRAAQPPVSPRRIIPPLAIIYHICSNY